MTSDEPALLAAIRAKPEEMTPRLAYLDWAGENQDQVRTMIEAAVAVLPLLTSFGIGVHFNRADTPAARQERFRAEQEALLRSVEGFAASVTWLADKAKRVTVNAAHTSYGYKHMVEEFFERGGSHCYVANGEFIAAAVHCGFAHKVVDSGPNVWFGISERSLKAARGARRLR